MENTAEDTTSSASETDLLLVVSKVKRHIKETAQMNSSSDFFDEINKKVVALIQQAVEHAKSDKRKTVMGRDVL